MGVDVEAIRARAGAASPEPWSIEYGNCGCSADGGCCKPGEVWPQVLWGPRDAAGDSQFGVSDIDELSAADAEFIAHARTDVPALLALVDEQAKQIKEAEWIIRRGRSEIDQSTEQFAEYLQRRHAWLKAVSDV